LGKIITLPEEVSLKIAAGEVIEGPFSVVRELIDNSIDAEAKEIRIIIKSGGKESVSVSDNGTGMSEDDAVVSVLKHTTSKIKRIEDLHSITSMGFRGEALASICNVSDFTLLTKRAVDPQGTRVTCTAAEEPRSGPAAANVGTVVTVQNLFRNLPARKKFLKSNRAEAAKVKDEIVKKAIYFFDKGFYYKVDDRVVIGLNQGADHRQRLEDIFGGNFGESLLEVHHEESSFSIQGYISGRNVSLPSRRGQYIFINGRPVSDRSLLYALNSPARGLVPAGRFFYAFVFILMETSLLDVNVHPAKKEVKIKPADQLYSALFRAVEYTLRHRYYDFHAVSGSGISRSGTPVYGEAVREPAGEDGNEVKKPPRLNIEDGEAGMSGFFSAFRDVITGEPKTEQSQLFDLSILELRYRGSLFRTFIFFEGTDFVLLVDQHAAHERVLYERYLKASQGTVAQKNLLIPINFTPPAAKYGDLLEGREFFHRAGIEIEPFGDESFNIVSLPGFIPEKREEETISMLFEEYYAGRIPLEEAAIRESFVKLAACRSAIKEGELLGHDEALSLLNDLFAADVPHVCPHGRPTLLRYGRGYFDRLFKRR
jgi:DNA mismatch repair protein MutL